jgi:hypothetical protein
MEVRIITLTTTSRLDELGNLIPQWSIQYMVGDYGPFTEVVDQKKLPKEKIADYIRQEALKLRGVFEKISI